MADIQAFKALQQLDSFMGRIAEASSGNHLVI